GGGGGRNGAGSRAAGGAWPAARGRATVRAGRNGLVGACCSAWPRAGWQRAASWPAAAYAAPTDWCASDTIGPGMCAGVVAVSRVPETDRETLPVTATPGGPPMSPGESLTAGPAPPLAREAG